VKRRRSCAHVDLFLRAIARGRCASVDHPSLLSWHWRSQAGPGRESPTNIAWWGHAMSIFALVILRGPINLAFPYICAKAVAAQGNVSVEVLLPKGGRCL
jgi:hypothetical protein